MSRKRKSFDNLDLSLLILEDEDSLFEPSTSTGRTRRSNRKKPKNSNREGLDPETQMLIMMDCATNSKITKSNKQHNMNESDTQLNDLIDGLLAKYGTSNSPESPVILIDSPKSESGNVQFEELMSFRKYWNQKENKKVEVEKKTPEPSDIIELDADEVETKQESVKERSCAICLDSLKDDLYVTFCGHIFHEPCIKKAVKMTKCCPFCRKKLTLKLIHPIFL